jgi:hypothetical protein
MLNPGSVLWRQSLDSGSNRDCTLFLLLLPTFY